MVVYLSKQVASFFPLKKYAFPNKRHAHTNDSRGNLFIGFC